MTTCTDVYVLPQTCGPVLYGYPSQVHPTPPPGPTTGAGGGHPWRWIDVTSQHAPSGVDRRRDEEEEALLMAMGVL